MAQKKVVFFWEFPPLAVILDNIYDIPQLVKDAGNLLCDTEIAKYDAIALALRHQQGGHKVRDQGSFCWTRSAELFEVNQRLRHGVKGIFSNL
jgi:hypothetical protein